MAKFKTKGAQLFFGSANPPTTQLLQLGDIEFDPGARAPLHDVTSHDNSTGTFEKLDPGFKEPAKITGEIYYDPADAVAEDMRAVLETYALRYAKLVLPDTGAATWIFSVRVSEFSIPLPVNGKLMSRFTIESIGANSFTA